jgi:hypothetical protein
MMVAQEYRIEAACILGCDDASLIPYRHPLVSALRVLTEAVVFSVLLIWAVPQESLLMVNVSCVMAL